VVEQSGKALSGLVRVTSAAPIATGYILPLIPRFHAAHPRVQIELHLDDAVSDMVTQGYDVGIRVGRLKDSSLVARSIAPLPFVVCASHSYLKQRGTPTTLDDLAQHNCLRLSRPGSRDPVPWFLKGYNASIDQSINGNLLLNDFAALVMAAAQGQGLVCVPLQMVMPLFRAGQLRPVLAHCIDPKFELYLYYPNRKNLPARTRSFIDFVLDQLQHEPDLNTPHAELLAPFIKLRG
jgi:DNA-binding transcriptional LysR family regulator